MGVQLEASSNLLEFEPTRPPRIGISACLLGDEVRFDGGHKRDAFLTDVLTPYVEWVRVCPEVEVGMGTPRETLRLIRDESGSVRLVTTRTAIDHTDSMIEWSHRRLDRLESEHLSGYVLKKDSPSCGMEYVKVFGPDGIPQLNGRGIFAEALLSRVPHLPVEDEGRLADPSVREHFIERVFAYQRLKTCFNGTWTNETLAAFHAAHEMTLLSHSAVVYRQLARVLARAVSDREQLRNEYERGFMAAVSIAPTRRRHARVLMRMAGVIEPYLEPGTLADVRDRIDDYLQDRVALIMPLTRIRDHARTHAVTALMRQTYLEFRPRELRLSRGE
jgi:uncharacterized protein YbbK (DUF523 family)/uncharacterized protein YbgA (DUF1722 family)